MKIVISLLVIISCSFAKLVGGVSIVVNNEPITLYEIDQTTKKYQISKNEAVDILIQQKIEDSQMRKLGIYVQEYEISKKMQELAAANGVSLDEFERILQSEGKDLDEIRQEIKNQLKKEKLYQSIISKKIKRADEDELRSYYNLHTDEFKMSKEVEVIEYVSKSRLALERLIKFPLSKIEGIKATPKTIKIDSMHPNIIFVLKNVKEGDFTPIMGVAEGYVVLFIKKKIGEQILPYESAKQEVFAKVMSEKEQNILSEYFGKLRATANIEVIRKP